MLALTVVAVVVALALSLSVVVRASDRFPTQTRGPGAWGVRSRLPRRAELTSAEERWRRLVVRAGDASEPWNELTAGLDQMADVLGLAAVVHPPTYSQTHLDTRVAELEAQLGAQQ